MKYNDRLEQVVLNFSGLLDCFENDYIKKPEAHNLTIKQLLYLTLISSIPVCTITTLAKKLSVKKPTVSNQISALEIKGLVKKKLSSKDARIHIIETTPKGKSILVLRRKLHRDFARKILKCLNEDEKILSLNLMNKICQSNKELLK